MKRILSLVLAAVMLFSVCAIAASANEVEPKTYNYVALGDSIASGYSLEESSPLETDRALILTQDLIDNPIQNAYAQVFGNALAEIGEEYGYTTTATNLATTAYRAEDVAQVILNEGFKGEVAEFILETFVGPGTSEALIPYHDLMTPYLNDADLVSIQLGANDMIMAAVYPVMKTNNPILQAMGLSASLTLFGYDPKLAAGAGLQMLMQHKDDITPEQVADAAKYFANIIKNMDTVVEDSANNVKDVVEAVQSVNPDADIAMINMFNPFGNSLELDGQVRDLCYVMKSIFVKAIDEAIDVEISIGDAEDVEPVSDEEVQELEDISVEITDIIVSRDYFKEMRKERLKALLNIAAEELTYPIQYLAGGKNVDPYIKDLNAQLKDISDETGSVYVDVYGISNECNLDPHPLAKGHAEIAEIMEATLKNTILTAMGVEIEPEEPEEPAVPGDVDGDGEITLMDVTFIQYYDAHMIKLSIGVKFLDVNGDGELDVLDATWIQRWLSRFQLPDFILQHFAKG